MQLIIDAGGSCCDIALFDSDQQVWQEDGYHPLHQSSSTFQNILRQVKLKVEEVPQAFHYYGAGVIHENIAGKLKLLINEEFAGASIHVHSDLLAAARAVFGKKPGVGSILGTGSLTYFYDGKNVVKKSPSLGYLLGDEGSGYSLGNGFLRLLLSDKLAPSVIQAFEHQFEVTQAAVLEQLYHSATDQKSYLSKFVPFVLAHKDESTAIQNLVHQNFRHWIKEQLMPFAQPPAKVGLSGSIAELFKKDILAVLNEVGYDLTKVVKSPIHELINYHRENTL